MAASPSSRGAAEAVHATSGTFATVGKGSLSLVANETSSTAAAASDPRAMAQRLPRTQRMTAVTRCRRCLPVRVVPVACTQAALPPRSDALTMLLA